MPVWLHFPKHETVSTFVISVLSALKTIREARAQIKVGVFGAKSSGADGAWYSAGGSRCFTKKSPKLDWSSFDMLVDVHYVLLTCEMDSEILRPTGAHIDIEITDGTCLPWIDILNIISISLR
jgi:hypothetical protein